jgi:hypothetical protein
LERSFYQDRLGTNIG